MKLIHILIRDDEFANENTDYTDYRECDKHFLISSEEYTEEKKNELKTLLDLYDEYRYLDYDDEEFESEKYDEVADVSKYNLLYEFFNQFTNYFDGINEVYIG